MKKIASLILAVFLVATGLSGGSLYEQSIARVLESSFSSPAISYLLVDVQTGTVVASRWKERQRPVPLGSVVKPFTALAYAQRHEFRYPEFVCRGVASGCWLPRGHGHIGMAEAIAFSCNAYFRRLAWNMRGEDVSSVVRCLGIGARLEGLPGKALIGLGEGWKISPEEVLRAYCQLASQAREPGKAELVRGMALSAQAGTGKAVGRALGGAPTLVKTGTAPCSHDGAAPGDGYVVALYPAELPRLALLVRVHGVPGARAAIVGGEMLRLVLDAN